MAKVKVIVIRTKNGVKRIVKSTSTARSSTATVPVTQQRQVQQAPQVPVAAQVAQIGRTDLLVIEDSTIRAILADPRYLNAVPCLQGGKKALMTVNKRCGRCDRRRKQLRADAMNQLKSCIAGLRGQAATNFKSLLGVQKVRIYQPGRKGTKPVPVTI